MLSPEQRTIALHALRGDRPIADLIANGAGTTTDIRGLIETYLREKADFGPVEVTTYVRGGAQILRDRRGVPHITADDPYDLFFALGYAQAQDRLWQLDYLRRQAYGRLSEVFGRSTLDADILSRTLGIDRVARGVYDRLAPESRQSFDAFADGVNAWMAQLPAGLPIEFETLGYGPELWQAVDAVAIQRRWWWYLTGRLTVLSTPEAVRAGVGDGPNFDAFFAPEGDVAYIVPPGNYDPSRRWDGQPGDPPTDFFGGMAEPGGSNNWAAAPSITRDGAALLASDPHVYFSVPVDWYEFHLHGAGYDAVGAAYPATPALLFGRNQQVAWGVTNNICSLRDLYVETLNPADLTEYRHDGQWAPLEERIESIAIRDDAPYRHTTRYAHSRPIVDHLLPEAALPRHLWPEERFQRTGLSLAWVGLEAGDETKCLLDLNRASSVDEAREALRGWRCPTFNFVLADAAGTIGYQCAGAIPLRSHPRRGYRFPDQSDDAWQGTVPFDELPRLHNPERGWVASANNPTAPPDFPYPLSGTWAPEDRAPRAELLLATTRPHTLDGFAAMQADVRSGRAERGIPGLLAALRDSTDERTRQATDLLQAWDDRLTTDSAAGAIFSVFFWRWHQRVLRTRFDDRLLPLVQDAGWGLSCDLLQSNVVEWFASDKARQTAIRDAFGEALKWLEDRFGTDLSAWKWGAIHRLGAVHPAARTPLQHELFDLPPCPHQGGAGTLASAFYLPPGSFDTRVGASYRLLAALGPDQTTRAVTWPGQSGHPGSPHYADQVTPFLADDHFTVPFAWNDVQDQAETGTKLTPFTF